MYKPSYSKRKRLVTRLLVVFALGWCVIVWAAVVWKTSSNSLVWVPAALAALSLIARRPWVTAISAIVVFGFAILTGFSIGMVYVPPAVALFVAATVAASESQSSSTHTP